MGSRLEQQLLEEKLRSLQTVGRELFKMLAPNWEDHDAETCQIINYFADRQHTELILKKIESKIKINCFYCKICYDCNKLEEHRKVFTQQGFWIFNKEIKCWNVFDPDWCEKNRVLKLIPCKYLKKGINKTDV